jgi:hypothetical protein
VGLLGLLGCGGAESSSEADARSRLKTPADPLAPADLDRLLAIVQAHGNAAMPEFAPAADDAVLDYDSRAKDLVSDIRHRLQELFDANRQGRVWASDEEWARALSQHETSGPEFAALVRSVSCAIMRVRLNARVNIDRLVANARAEVKDLVSTMEAIDDSPRAERSRQDGFIRAQSAIRLGRAVALREFSEMIKQVPQENCALVRQYKSQLKPLLPSGGANELLSELQALGTSRPSEVVPAGHSTSGGE